MAIFINTSPDRTLFRTIVFPRESRRLDLGTTLLIPTYDRETIIKVLGKLKNGSNFKFRTPKSCYIPLKKTDKIGTKSIIYRNNNTTPDVKYWKNKGFTNTVYIKDTIKDYNGIIDYTKYLEYISSKYTLTANNAITLWEAFLDFYSVDNSNYLIWTPETMGANILALGKIQAIDWKSTHWYILFLYHMKYNYKKFIQLFRSRNINVIYTDYKYTLNLMFNDESYDEYDTGYEFLTDLFKQLRRMKLGVMIEEESDELTIVDDNVDSNIEDELKESITDNISSIVDKDFNMELIESLEKLQDNTSDISKEAEAIIKIIENSRVKETIYPPRLHNLRKRSMEVFNSTVEQLEEDLRKENEELVETKVVPLDNDFNTFRLQNMEKQYASKYKTLDRLNCLNHLGNSSNPIILTKYKSERALNSPDASYENVQVTFESPDNAKVKHTFTFKMPVLKDDKFLYLGNSDKVLTKQKIALPIIRLEDAVCVTTYYNKLIISLSSGNYSREAYKITKFIKYLRKNFSSSDLVYFSFIPTHEKGLSNNYYYEELVNISRYVSEILIDENNYMKLDAKSTKIGRLDGILYHASNNNENIHDEHNNEEISIIEYMDRLIRKIPEDIFIPIWEDSIKGKGSDNIVYTKTLDYPLLNMILHAYDYNLLPLLERLKDEYNLDYKIIPYDSKKRPPKTDNPNNEDDIIFNNFVLRIKYNNLANRVLLSRLLIHNFTDLDSLNVMSVFEDDLSVKQRMELDNYRDLLIDPITADVMYDLGIPTDYVGALLYANALMFIYNRPINEVSLKYERMPSNNELIEGCMYKAISSAWATYNNKLKAGLNPERNKFSIEPDAVIKILQNSPSMAESSKLNPVQHIASLSVISNKGIQGLGINNDRAYNMTKRRWDESFVGIMSDVSPYTSKSGVNKVLAVNPNITNIRGYFNQTLEENASPSEMMAVTEGLGTFAQKHDSSPRTAMGYQQFGHLMPTIGSESSLVTYGLDETLSYLDSDFAIRAKGKGKVVALTDELVKIKYDNEELGEVTYPIKAVVRNAAKAFYITNDMKKMSNIKLNSVVNEDDVIAYNEMLYEDLGDGVPIFKSGPIVNIGIACTHHSYEDAVIISETLAEKLKSKTVKRIVVKLNPMDRIGEHAKISNTTQIDAGETLIKYLESDGSPMNTLFGDKTELNDILSKNIKSHYQGYLRDIYIHMKIDEKVKMDKTVKEFINYVENYYNDKNIAKFRTKYIEENNNVVEHVIRYPVSKKIKVSKDLLEKGEILVEFFVEVEQGFSTADKITFGNTALKGVSSIIIRDEDRPYGVKTGRKLDAILSPISPLARKIYSLFLNGILSSCMEQANKDILDIINNG